MSAYTRSRVEAMTTTAYTVICPTGNVVEMPDADAAARYVEWGHTCAAARFHAIVSPGATLNFIEYERRRVMGEWENFDTVTASLAAADDRTPGLR